MAKPVSPRLHRTLDFVSVLLLLAAGPIVGFEGKPASITSTLAGAVLVYSVFTWYVKMIKLRMHLVIDAAAGMAMIIAPFWIGFRDDDRACYFFITFGVVLILVALLTEPESSPS